MALLLQSWDNIISTVPQTVLQKNLQIRQPF